MQSGIVRYFKTQAEVQVDMRAVNMSTKGIKSKESKIPRAGVAAQKSPTRRHNK